MGNLLGHLGIEDIRGQKFAYFDGKKYIMYEIDESRPFHRYNYDGRGENILVLNVNVEGKPLAWPLDEHLQDIDEEMINHLNLKSAKKGE